MQTIVDLFVVAMAANGLVDAWRNGSLFAGLRARIQVQQDSDDPESLRQWLWELLLCSFCHSYHVAVWLYVIITVGDVVTWTDAAPVGLFIRAVVTGVAAARLSLILNGLLPLRLRYERNPFTDNIDARSTSDTLAGATTEVSQATDGATESPGDPAEPANDGREILSNGGELGGGTVDADSGARSDRDHP